MAAPRVVGLAEIAQRLGVSKSYARELSLRRGFPAGTKLTQGWVWATVDVEAWIAKHPRPGQPSSFDT
jgi:predicted DNA-binding transcriptional regulator AlpA